MKKGIGILLRILSVIIWIWCSWKFIFVFIEKQDDFDGWYRMYNRYGSISPVSPIIFYGIVTGVIIISIIGIVAAIKQKRTLDTMAIVGSIAIMVVFFLMDRMVQSLENHFMDTSNIYMLYCAMAVYVANIEKRLYLYLGLNALFIKLKHWIVKS